MPEQTDNRTVFEAKKIKGEWCIVRDGYVVLASGLRDTGFARHVAKLLQRHSDELDQLRDWLKLDSREMRAAARYLRDNQNVNRLNAFATGWHGGYEAHEEDQRICEECGGWVNKTRSQLRAEWLSGDVCECGS